MENAKKIKKIKKLRLIILICLFLLMGMFWVPTNFIVSYSNLTLALICIAVVFLIIIEVISLSEKGGLLIEIIDVLAVVFPFYLAYLVLACFFVFVSRIDGSSMEPNFHDNQLILVNRFNVSYERFDVVFVNVSKERTSYYQDDFFLKRIVGLPGETIEYKSDMLYIDGTVVTETFENGVTKNFKFAEVCMIAETSCDVIPEDYYFVLGDNRQKSTDSRVIGLVHKDDLFGKIIYGL